MFNKACFPTMSLYSYRKHRIYNAANMNYGFGSVDPNELAHYNKIRKRWMI